MAEADYVSTLATDEAAICSRIKTVLEGVTAVGNVYTRERWAALLDEQREIGVYSVDGEPAVRFWTISLMRMPMIDVPTRHSGSHRRGKLAQFTYRIRGIFGHNDGDDTETPAKVVVMDVIAELNDDVTLNETYYRVVGAHLESFDLVHFGPDLVHLAEIHFAVEDTV
jgi:hypothetical protein